MTTGQILKAIEDSEYGLTRAELVARYPDAPVGGLLQTLRRRRLIMYDRASLRWVLQG